LGTESRVPALNRRFARRFRCSAFPACNRAILAYLCARWRTRTCLWPMVVMQRRNASFLAVRLDAGSREGGRYGCNPDQGRRALLWRRSARHPSARAGQPGHRSKQFELAERRDTAFGPGRLAFGCVLDLIIEGCPLR